MSSAVKIVLGVSTLAFAVGFAGCDNGGTDAGTAGAGAAIHPVGGGSSQAGTTATGGSNPGGGASTGGAGGADASGVPLIPAEGWVDGKSNGLGIQGAIISYADDTSKAGPPAMVTTTTGSMACISGLAALVDTKSVACSTMTFTPPATDCYGQFWGAAIALNLNQPNDPVTMMGGTAVAFDASQITGFAFDVTGNTVPGGSDFRFNVEDASGQFCNIPTHKIVTGTNTFPLTDLVKACYKITADPPNPTVTPAVQAGLIKISWQVVTNTSHTVPFDFCISNLRAITKPGAVLMGVAGSTGAGGSTGSAGAGVAGSSTGGAGASSGGAGAGGAAAGSGAGGAAAGSGGATGGKGGSGGTGG